MNNLKKTTVRELKRIMNVSKVIDLRFQRSGETFESERNISCYNGEISY